MAEKWRDDKHGIIIEDNGSLAHIPPDSYDIQIDFTCPECGCNTWEEDCDCFGGGEYDEE